MTGDGVPEFFEAVEASREEYEKEYLPELARVRAQREATLQKQKEDSTARMLADLAVNRARDPNFAAQDQWNPGEEEQEEEDDGGELNIIDRSEDPWPGQYIDLTQTQTRPRDQTWPRPT